MQYIYRHFGRERAGLTAAVITYRTRSAIREVAKAFGLSDDLITALTSTTWGHGSGAIKYEEVRNLGLDPGDPDPGDGDRPCRRAVRLSAPSVAT